MLQLAFAMLLQLSLCMLAEAAPVTAQGITWQVPAGGGIVGFIIIVLDIIAWIEILKSNRTPSEKILWALIVLLFPFAGMIIYYVFSNRASHNSGGYEAIPS